MKSLLLNSLRFIPTGLCLAVCLLANNAKAVNQYFDVNGTTAGYGIANGGSYSWDGANWATASGGGAATANWVAGQFARFPGGVSGNSYTVTVNADESMAGLYNSVSGTTLTINGAGSGTLDVVSGYQGFLVTGNVIINAPISGVGGVGPEQGGSLYLYGNNTYSGGTEFGFGGSPLTFINNNNSFGSGPVTMSAAAGNYAAVLATAPVTLANNFTTVTSGNGINFASSASSPVISTGTWSLGANNILIRNNGNSTSPLTLSGQISGTASLNFSGANGGKIILSGANTYSGSTTVGITGDTAITLTLGAANTIASSSSLIMAGGITDPNGQVQTMRSTTLGLTANSTFDYTSGAAEMDFANSSGVAWTSGMTLNLKSTGGGNWNLSGDALEIGTDTTGLIASQLLEIEFNGADLGAAGMTSTGYIYDTAQVVPEPSTALLGLLGGLGVMSNIRRRRTA